MTLFDLIFTMESWGFSEVILPFFLLFIVLYAVLSSMKILSDKSGINVTLAIVLSLITVIPHVMGIYPPSFDPVVIIRNLSATMMLVLVASLSAIILMGVMGIDIMKEGGKSSPFFAILSVIGINTFVYIFYPYMFPLVVTLTVILGIFFSMTKTDKPSFISYLPAVLLIVFIIVFRGSIPQNSKHLPWILRFLEQPQVLSIVIIVGIVVIVIKFMTKD